MWLNLLFSPATLSDADRDRVHGYLAHKWGQTAIFPVEILTKPPLPSPPPRQILWEEMVLPLHYLDMRVEFRNGIPATEPNKLDGLALWLDASDSSTVIKDSSNKVNNWSDKSGNGVSVSQSDSAKQPTFTASGLNNLPTLTFDGSNDYLTSSSNITQPYSAFLVAKTTGVVQVNNIFRRCYHNNTP